MVAAAFVAPYLLEATARFVSCAAFLPDVRLGLVTSDPLERIAPELRSRLAGHWRGAHALGPPPNAGGGAGLGRAAGRGRGAAGAPGGGSNPRWPPPRAGGGGPVGAGGGAGSTGGGAGWSGPRGRWPGGGRRWVSRAWTSAPP